MQALEPLPVVRRSPVAGLGLFATREYRKGQAVVEYTGRLTTDKADENEYTFTVDDKYNLDGSPRSNLARYANHACKIGNCTIHISNRRRIWLVARWAIKPGDEILYSYGRAYMEGWGLRDKCRCKVCANGKH